MLLVAAVDGTNSSDWRPKNRNYSHVLSLFQDIQGKNVDKAYWDGPSTLGFNSGEIKQGVYDWITGRLRSNVGNDNMSIALIGHSRGGAVVTDVARMLQERSPSKAVSFMGLYDAVDRSDELGTFAAEFREEWFETLL